MKCQIVLCGWYKLPSAWWHFSVRVITSCFYMRPGSLPAHGFTTNTCDADRQVTKHGLPTIRRVGLRTTRINVLQAERQPPSCKQIGAQTDGRLETVRNTRMDQVVVAVMTYPYPLRTLVGRYGHYCRVYCSVIFTSQANFWIKTYLEEMSLLLSFLSCVMLTYISPIKCM